jgi:ADP-heptose:LPS heptosyltransferase
MAADPVLVLQMQRMGDLILSFPLFLGLSRCYPRRERTWLPRAVLSPPYARSPPVTYIPGLRPSRALAGRRYRLIVNLSIREEAARLPEA